MTPKLVTITFSHYCEKARWALDRAGIAYTEEGHLPLFAWVPALRAGRRRMVPSLVTDEGAVNDSTDILRWVDRRGGASPLFPDDAPEVAELEEMFDLKLGPHSRRIAYDFVLPRLRSLVEGVRNVPRAEVVISKALAPVVSRIMRRGLKVDAAGVARSRERVDQVFAEVERRLADGRRYLTGNQFTAADLTFAALATALVAPPQLADYLPVHGMPPAMADAVDGYRATQAGGFALRLYAEDRGTPGAAAITRA